jgi:hypothetical protein
MTPSSTHRLAQCSATPVHGVKTIIFSSFHRIFSRKLLRFFVRETSRLFAGRAPGLSGNFYVRALKLIADTEHGVGTGPAPLCLHTASIQQVGARAGILILEDCTGSVGSSQTDFNFVFSAFTAILLLCFVSHQCLAMKTKLI